MDEPRISPTFDDGPHPAWTPRVLDALDGAQARATFFVIAPLAWRYPALISETIRRGHRIELHCTRHIRHTESSRQGIEHDTREGLATLQALGARPCLWRPPWGVLAAWTKTVAEQFGLELALWDADTHDWRGDDASEMLQSISSVLGPGSVVLMHDGPGPGALRSGCGNTVALIPLLAEHIRSLGCEPAPVEPSAIRESIRP